MAPKSASERNVSLPIAGAAVEAVDWDEALLKRSIQLQEVDTDVYLGSKDDLWKPTGARGIFGGQIICQTLHAAMLSVPRQLVAHSFHGYFLLSGDPSKNILLHVNRVRDGTSFATRGVVAKQRGTIIFSAMAQFHKPEPSMGLEVGDPMPKVPGPEGLKSNRARLEELAGDSGLSERMREMYRKALSQPTRVERRQAPAPEGVDLVEPTQYYWLRATGCLGDDTSIHFSCIAFMSDMEMLSCAYVPFGGLRRNPPSMMVSLDHSMWFHSTAFRADDWLLFKISCRRATASRILSFCQVWSRAGDVVFSCSQEGLARHSREIQITSAAADPLPRARL